MMVQSTYIKPFYGRKKSGGQLWSAWLLGLLLLPGHADAASIGLSKASPDQKFQFITIMGEIIGGDAEQLDQILQSAQSQPQRKLAVMLDSPGGDVDVAMAMGRAIRHAGAATYHHYCASACVLAFLGGTERFMAANSDAEAELNVHRPELAEAYLANPTPFTEQMVGLLRSYVVTMTGSSSFYDTMMTIPFAAPRPLRPAEALSMQVITSMPQ